MEIFGAGNLTVIRREGMGFMGFVVMFAAAWLAVFVLYSMNKSLSVLENAFVFLIVLTLGINISWIVAEEFKLIALTKNGLLYSGFIIFRSVVVPLLLVIAMNVIFKYKSAWGVVFAVAGTLAVFLALNGAALFYKIHRYERWNIGYDALVFLSLTAVVYALLQLYRKVVYGRYPA